MRDKFHSRFSSLVYPLASLHEQFVQKQNIDTQQEMVPGILKQELQSSGKNGNTDRKFKEKEEKSILL